MNHILIQFAQRINANEVGVPTGGGDTLLQNALNLAYFLAGAIAVIVIIVAGIWYVVSSGDAGRVAKAKNLLTYAIGGLVIIVSAFAITNFVIGRFK